MRQLFLGITVIIALALAACSRATPIPEAPPTTVPATSPSADAEGEREETPAPEGEAAPAVAEATATAAPAAGPVVNPFGLVLRASLQSHREAVLESGARWVRTSIAWKSVEPEDTEPDGYIWTTPDAELGPLFEAGIRPIVMIWENPAWAATTTCGPIDRAELSDFAEFFGAVVERYDGDGEADAPGSPIVRVYQFYNEPDWQIEAQTWLGGCWGEHGAAYADMLGAAYEAGHAASSDVIIVFGSIGGEDIGVEPESNQPYFNFDLGGDDFVDAVLRRAAERDGPTFDAFAMHYFPAFGERWTRWGPDLLGKVAYYRERLADFGFDVPFYCLEIGRRSDPQHVIDDVPGSPEVQADYIVKGLARAKVANLAAVTWFSLLDEQTFKWGLLTLEGTRKPSFHAYKLAVEQMGDARYLEPLATNDGFEGYWFRRPDGSRLLVAWANERGQTLTLPTAAVDVTNVAGTHQTVEDGTPDDDDGSANGQVRLRLSSSPLYITIP